MTLPERAICSIEDQLRASQLQLVNVTIPEEPQGGPKTWELIRYGSRECHESGVDGGNPRGPSRCAHMSHLPSASSSSIDDHIQRVGSMVSLQAH